MVDVRSPEEYPLLIYIRGGSRIWLKEGYRAELPLSGEQASESKKASMILNEVSFKYADNVAHPLRTPVKRSLYIYYQNRRQKAFDGFRVNFVKLT